MILIDANPIQNPDAAEQKLAALWNFTAGRRFCLLLVGQDEGVKLGVMASNRETEIRVGELVANLCATDGDDATISSCLVPETFQAANEVAIINLHWADRHLPLEGKNWGWQRYDPLSTVYATLASLPPGVLAVVGISLRALPHETFRASMFSAACSSTVEGQHLAEEVAWKVASAYGGIGVKLRRPLLQGRAVQRALGMQMRFPMSVLPVNIVSRFWHPPLQDRSSGPRP